MGGKYGNIGDTVMDVLRTVHTVVLSEKIGASTTPTNSTAPIILARRLSLKGLNSCVFVLPTKCDPGF